jgi:plastocyanin
VVMGNAGDTYSVTFNTPGTYTYDCGVHGAAMSGRIVVQ